MITTLLITATRSGTPSTIIINRGAKGDPGIDGADGAPGADGTPGSDANVTNANVNTAISTNTSATRAAMALGDTDNFTIGTIVCTASRLSLGRDTGVYDLAVHNTTLFRGYDVRFGNQPIRVIPPLGFVFGQIVGNAMIHGVDGTRTMVVSCYGLDGEYGDIILRNLTGSGAIETTTTGEGFIAKSPNGNRWRLTPDNSGNSVWTAL